MKCLRCGREMGNNYYCKCGHYYENNLNKRTIQNENKAITKALIIVFIVVFSQVIFINVLITILTYKIDINSHDDIELYEACNIYCENTDYHVEKNKCICENGKTYILDK